MPRHIIKQQRLELTVPSEAQAHLIEARLKELYVQEVIPELDKLFSHLAPNGTTIEVPYLEIDLGTLAPSDLEGQFSKKVFGEIRGKMDQLVAKSFAGESDEIAIRPTGDSVWDTWLHFLATGYLPWWAGPRHPAWPPDEILDYLTLSPSAVTLQLLDVLKHKNARQRLVLQFDDDFVQEMLVHLLSEFKQADIYINALNNLLQDLSVTVSQQELNMSIAAAVAYTTNAFGNDDAFLSQLARQLILLPALKAQVVLSEQLSSGSLSSKVLTNKHGLRLLNKLREEVRIAAGQSKGKDTASKEDALLPPAPEAEIFIANAGLVLLWPYLPRLFDNLGLLAGDTFASTEAAGKAVHVLQYAVTSASASPEHLLPLNKILCGIPWNMPVEMDGRLTEGNKAEIESLLESVIQNWGALKNTSPDGFRNTFLVRNGKLMPEDNSWHLLVKRTGFDVLLDKLPWSIGLVKLPWMPGPIHVQW